MSKLSEDLRTLKIHNPHNFMAKSIDLWGPNLPFIGYNAADNGRCGRGAHWTVYIIEGPGTHREGNPHWQDHGHQTFSCFGPGTAKEVRDNQLTEAKAFVARHWGEFEWVKLNLLGQSWVPKESYDLVMAELKRSKVA